MHKVLLVSVLLGISPSLLAAPTTPKPPIAAPDKPAIEQINAGELRLDGQISALLGTGLWQLDANSWTSPRGIKTNFDEVKSKPIQLAPDAFIHPLGSMAKSDIKDITLKSHIAVIGKNDAEGKVRAREIILLGEYDEMVDVGDVLIDEEPNRLITLSRLAYDAGQLSRALELAKQGADAAVGGGDTPGEALCMQEVAVLYSALRQPESAITAFKRVQLLGQRLNSPMFQVLALKGQAAAFTDTGQNEQAISFYKSALALSSTTSIVLQINVLSALATAQTKAKHWDEAVDTWCLLFPLQDKASRYSDATRTIIWVARYQAPTDLVSAKKHLEIARERMRTIQDESKRRLLIYSFANALRAIGDMKGAKAQYELATKLAEAKGDSETATRMRKLAEAIIIEENEDLQEPVEGQDEQT
ncbi:hypothetical protein IAD21_02147 [Abditibacteriota bacterium]|nr:hypothetical protein IAD21_02147 [Abditibacteriota bacterium]